MRKPAHVLALTAIASIPLVGFATPAASAAPDNTDRNHAIHLPEDNNKDKKVEPTTTLSVEDAVKVSDKSVTHDGEKLPQVNVLGSANTENTDNIQLNSDSDNSEGEGAEDNAHTFNIVNSEHDNESNDDKEANEAENFVAHIYVSNDRTTTTIVVKDKDTTVEKALSKHGFNADTVRTATGDTVKADDTFSNGDTLSLFANHATTKEREIELEPSTKVIKDDTMLVGEREVISEGKKGKGIKTSVITTNTALDKGKNTKADIAGKHKNELETIDENLTITEAPEKKVVKIGTLEVDENGVLIEADTGVDTVDSAGNRRQLSTSMGAVGDGHFNTYSSSEISKLQAKTQNEAVRLAYAQLGKPYVWGAVGPDSFDCSGLIYWIYRTNLGYNIPRIAGDQGAYATPVRWEDAKPGDIFYLGNQHVGMIVSTEGGPSNMQNWKLLHASTPERGVVVDSAGWAIDGGYSVGRFEK